MRDYLCTERNCGFIATSPQGLGAHRRTAHNKRKLNKSPAGVKRKPRTQTIKLELVHTSKNGDLLMEDATGSLWVAKKVT